MSGPPPPPPPCAPPPPPPPTKLKQVDGAPPEVTNPDDNRQSLLESIRQAGGFYRANLKSAKDRKLGVIRKKGAMGGEDLMGDLKEKMVASGRACPKLRNASRGMGPTLPSGRRLPPGAVPMFGPR